MNAWAALPERKRIRRRLAPWRPPQQLNRLAPRLAVADEAEVVGVVAEVLADRAASASRQADAAHAERNLMEPLLECARAHASEGEIVQSLQQVFGSYTETPVF